MSEYTAKPYKALSKATSLKTFVPASMAWELAQALRQLAKDLKKKGYNNVDDYVREKLNYSSKSALYKALGAEQIDVLAMAIFKMENRNESVVNGDETGVGKGRTAGGMVRYAIENNMIPIFVTDNVDLMNDLFRDLEDVGYAQKVKPFVLSQNKEYKGIIKTEIVQTKDENGNLVDVDKETVLHPKLKAGEIKEIVDSGLLGNKYNAILTVYSQFNDSLEYAPEDKKKKKTGDGKSDKRIKFMLDLLRNEDCVLIMDEAHKASGSDSTTGNVFRHFVSLAEGTYFLSATYSKRPDTFALYATKTPVVKNFKPSEIESILESGGNALLEVTTAGLVKNGNIFRREKTKKGIAIDYVALDKKAEVQQALYDEVIKVIQDIDKLNREYVVKFLQDLKKEGFKQGKDGEFIMKEVIDPNTGKPLKDKKGNIVKEKVADTKVIEGVNIQDADQVTDIGRTSPIFSRLFNFVYSLFFSIKAEEIADLAINEIENDRKPVIAFFTTNEAILKETQTISGEPPTVGSEIYTDYGVSLNRFLDSIFNYSVDVAYQKEKEKVRLDVEQLPIEGQNLYKAIKIQIKNIGKHLSISPIDTMRERIEEAGYSVVEVSGRSYQVSHKGRENGKGIFQKNPEINRTEGFSDFNRNKKHVLFLSSSGTTGASAHAFRPKGMKGKVLPRTMIMAQFQLDINQQVQMAGRINRTGQLSMPKYIYPTSTVPSEMRLLQMLKLKLRTLDAGTTSSQTTSKNILDVSDNSDFLNKYGDEVVTTYLQGHPSTLDKMGGFDLKKPKPSATALKRMQLLTCKDQGKFYDEVLKNYQNHIKILIQNSQYDLEVEFLDFKAILLSKTIKTYQEGKVTSFSGSTFQNIYEVDALRKPYRQTEVETIIRDRLNGKTAEQYQRDLVKSLDDFIDSAKVNFIKDEKQRLLDNEDDLKKKVEDEKKLLAKLKKEQTESEKRITKGIERFELKRQNIKPYFSNLLVGQGYKIKENEEGDSQKCVFAGFKIDSDNFAPSSIEALFLIAGTMRRRTFYLSDKYRPTLDDIIKLGNMMPSYERSQVLENWNIIIKESERSREKAVVMTGNLMMIFKNLMDKGGDDDETTKGNRNKLVDFTLADGDRTKGIVTKYLRDEIDEQRIASENEYLIIPLLKAIPVYRNTNYIKISKLELRRNENVFEITMPSSRKEGTAYWGEDTKLRQFYQSVPKTISGYMVSTILASDLEEYLKVLATEQSVFVEVSKADLDKYGIDLDLNVEEKDTKPTPKLIEAKPEKIEVSDEAIMSNDEVLEIIEALKITLELADNKAEEEEIKEMIEVWEIVAE